MLLDKFINMLDKTINMLDKPQNVLDITNYMQKKFVHKLDIKKLDQFKKTHRPSSALLSQLLKWIFPRFVLCGNPLQCCEFF